MTKNIALSRPAMSAIAAFLVLSTPGAFAQEIPTVTMTPPVAEPTPQTPPTVAAPSTPAPVALPQAAQPPVAQPVIRVPLDIPEEPAAAPATTTRAETAAPARAERNVERTNVQRPAAPAPAAAAAAPAATPASEAPALAEAAPIAAPVAVPAEPVAQPATPVETANVDSGNSFPWEIAGGAAVLLIVGGAGIAYARRRRVAAEQSPALAYESVLAPDAVAQTSESQPWITPAYEPRETAAAPRSVPAFAAAPSGNMGRHEAMAMTGPTPDNPFATLTKRLRRARFLDRQERVAYDATLGQQKDMTRKPASAWEIAQRPAPATQQQQEVRRPEPSRVRTTTSFRPGYSNN